MALLVALLALSYLLGSIPTSVIVTRLVKGVDIRRFGSGNAGGTNVLRVVGWKAALVVAAVDVGKGSLAALLPRLVAQPLPLDPVLAAMLCGALAVVGHCFPLFAGFRGGKGVGTTAGMLLVVQPLAAAAAAPLFFLVVALTRMVSLGSMIAALALPVVVWILRGSAWVAGNRTAFSVLVALSLFIVFNHRTNIARIIRGSENRLGAPTKSETPPSSGE